MRMCHSRANSSVSTIPASAANEAITLANVGEVATARPMQGAASIVDLEQHVDEEASFERTLAEPLVEHVEDGEQSLGRLIGAAPNLVGEPRFGPQRLAPPHDLDHELVLRSEVAVHGHLRDIRALDDRVDTDRPDAVLADQRVRGLDQSLAGVAGRGRCRRDRRSLAWRSCNAHPSHDNEHARPA